ncbi:DUF975 family protein [Bombilactobacillus folatiphilus]|uniref:DUF975 family protein n=1 Tax=Bombilactobacillus folatiphilus TaxID=2923362 RepID=A0ABY4P9N7_9LACO|nr:DUF975 family protein [Bombilactobacillus folatiphilus]UQS82107.1 DUF975 family protein [Bombilactobacillus folatiphilus]
MNRTEIKQQAKKLLNHNFLFFLQLFLISLIFYLLNRVPSVIQHRLPLTVDALGVAGFLSIVAGLFEISADFAAIDIMKEQSQLDHPFQKSFTLFKRGELFIGSIGIGVLMYIWIFLWSLLLLVPGIIKSFAYSQAMYIYRDHLNAEDPVTYRQAVTLSRQLMNGHKMDYFVFNLSFIGYWLLVSVTLGIAAIWVLPYYRLSKANFYVNLVQNQNLTETKLA